MWSLRRKSRPNSGGFVFAEFAIALPLLILLLYGLATVGIKIFYLGKIQLADYVLEEEVHDVLSRLIYDARAAKKVDVQNGAPQVTFVYRTINEIQTKGYGSGGGYGTAKGDVIADKEENRVYLIPENFKKKGSKMNYKRQTEGGSNPITGDNYFGETRVTQFEFDKPADKVLRITLEMQSEVSGHKIKISTAVYMPGCEEFTIGW